MQHGKATTYRYQGCRCAPCRAANVRAIKVWRLRTDYGVEPLTVPVVGSRRRLQALARVGHTLQAQAQACGLSVDTLKGACYNKRIDRVWLSTAEAIAGMYEQLWATKPVGRYATRCRGLAERKGWLPPLAWDDESIDDPASEPAVLAVALNADAPFELRCEAAKQMLALGFSQKETSKRASVNARTARNILRGAAA